MSDRRNLPIERNNTHFVLGAVAAGLALALPRSSAWQKPLAAAAAFGFGMALLRAPHPVDRLEEDADEAVAPELTRSAMIDGVLMRWEEHGSGKDDDVPVVMVHGIPTNPRIWRYIIPRADERRSALSRLGTGRVRLVARRGAGPRYFHPAAGRLSSFLAPASGHSPGGVCRP